QARKRLRRVESELARKSLDLDEPASASTSRTTGGSGVARVDKVVLKHNGEILKIRGVLESVEEELLRLLQRLADANTRDPILERVRERYSEGLDELRT